MDYTEVSSLLIHDKTFETHVAFISSHGVVNRIFHDIKGLRVDDQPIPLIDALIRLGWDCSRFYFGAKPIRLDWDFQKEE